jgi:hypothetical protein
MTDKQCSFYWCPNQEIECTFLLEDPTKGTHILSNLGPRGIEEEWNDDDEVRITGNLVYTMPEVSAESRAKGTPKEWTF